MRVLIIGYGSMGGRHAANARDLGHEVMVLESAEARREAAEVDGFGACINPLSVPLETVDAVVIATPAATHRKGVQYLRRDGYAGPLFVEKPLDVDDHMGHIAWHWFHPTAMVGYNWRFHPEVLQWRGSYGLPDSWHLVCETRMASWPGSDYSSPLLECSHELDLLRAWRGPEAKIVQAGEWHPDGRFIQFDNGDLVDVRWDKAPSRRFTASWLQREVTHALVGGGESKSGAHWTRTLSPCWAGEMIEASYREEMRAFLSAAEARTPVPGAATIADGLAVVSLVLRVEEMAS